MNKSRQLGNVITLLEKHGFTVGGGKTNDDFTKFKQQVKQGNRNESRTTGGLRKHGKYFYAWKMPQGTKITYGCGCWDKEGKHRHHVESIGNKITNLLTLMNVEYSWDGEPEHAILLAGWTYE